MSPRRMRRLTLRIALISEYFVIEASMSAICDLRRSFSLACLLPTRTGTRYVVEERRALHRATVKLLSKAWRERSRGKIRLQSLLSLSVGADIRYSTASYAVRSDVMLLRRQGLVIRPNGNG